MNLDINDYMVENGVLKQIYVNDGFLNIPKDVRIIDKNLVISDREKIVEINFPNNLIIIEDKCFRNCKNLKRINFDYENGDLVLSDSCFENCNLESVKLPKTVTTIGNSCFAYNTNLKSIAIPTSIKAFGYWVFERCNENNIRIIYNDTLENFKKIKNSQTFLDFYQIVTKEKMKLEDLIETGYSFIEANKFLAEVVR